QCQEREEKGLPLVTDAKHQKTYSVVTDAHDLPIPFENGGFVVIEQVKSNPRLRAGRKHEGPKPIRIKPIRHEVIEQVILLGLDDASLVGAPPPQRLLAGSLADLNKPDAVVVDFTRLQKLFPGDAWWLNKMKPREAYVHPIKDAQGHV